MPFSPDVPIGDPRQAGETGPAGDQRPTGSTEPAGDPRPAGDVETTEPDITDGKPAKPKPKGKGKS